MNYAALALGANFIEKTITLDKTTDAVEHYMSLEVQEIKELIQLDIKDDVGLALVETNAGRRMWFAYRFAGKIWNFNGFIKDSAKIE